MNEKYPKKQSAPRKMTVPERVFAATALALSLLAVGLTVAVVAAPKAVAQPQSTLYINDIFAVLDESASDNKTASLVFEISMTNTGDAPGEGVKLRAYAKRSTGLVDARGDVDFGTMEVKKTITRTLQMGLPQGRLYTVELRVEEASLVVLSGQGTVDLRDTVPPAGGQSSGGGGANFDKDKVNQPGKDTTYPDAAGAGSMGGGLTGALFGVLLLVGLLVLAWFGLRAAAKKPWGPAAAPGGAGGFYRP